MKKSRPVDIRPHENKDLENILWDLRFRIESTSPRDAITDKEILEYIYELGVRIENLEHYENNEIIYFEIDTDEINQFQLSKWQEWYREIHWDNRKFYATNAAHKNYKLEQ